MVQKRTSIVLPVVVAAVFAGLGRMVVQKIKADREAREKAQENRISIHLDETIRARISEAMRRRP